jgi:ribonuclease T2
MKEGARMTAFGRLAAWAHAGALAGTLAGALAAAGAAAQDRAGDFDRYILALSWSPSWCAAERGRSDAEQCREQRRFIVHGLWPQRADGWPEYCRTSRRDPTRRETAAMADLMGSGGLAWHQWRKHGRCADMDPAAYFDATRRAAKAIRVPPGLATLNSDVHVDARIIEEAFVRANPGLRPESVSVVCRNRALHEVRICLDLQLSPMTCAKADQLDCKLNNVAIPGP